MRTLTMPRVPSSCRLASLLLAVAMAGPLAVPGGTAAQAVTVGGVAGLARSRQLLERASDSDPRDGFVVGAWMDVVTPLPLLHVLAEAGYARRGGRFPLAGPAGLTGLTGLTGTVESDWITFTTVPVLHVTAGPVAAFAYGGPMLELHVRTRSAAALRNAYLTPSDQGFSAIAGGGLEGRLDAWSMRFEARVVQGLSSAYAGSAGDVRQRSYEVLLRVGKRRVGAASPVEVSREPDSACGAPGMGMSRGVLSRGNERRLLVGPEGC